MHAVKKIFESGAFNATIEWQIVCDRLAVARCITVMSTVAVESGYDDVWKNMMIWIGGFCWNLLM